MIFICQKAVGLTISGILPVTATVINGGNCSLGGVRNMLFPQYSPLNSNPDDATGSVTVTCTPGMAYDIGINQGQSAGATEEHRMVTRRGGKQELNYGLFQDGNHKYNYGTILGQNTLHQVGIGSPQIITIYGEIPINQLVEIGPYTDTVTIFLIF
jgi:spore coat protein U domain-containing protein, fimbrial subunit CupE1/2/3/6